MRVIAGERRRYVLKSPKGDKIRPTSDQIKETLFNMIGNMLYDKVFVDMFAGTGQIGIEALSRGANFCVFIDKDRDAIKLINENIEHTGYDEYSRVLQSPLPGGIKRLGEYSPDIIFMDPPYKANLYQDTLTEISGISDLSPDILIIAESDKNEDFSFVNGLGFFIDKEKIYKSSKHVFIRKNE